MFINVLDEVKALASNLGFAALTGKEVAQASIVIRGGMVNPNDVLAHIVQYRNARR